MLSTLPPTPKSVHDQHLGFGRSGRQPNMGPAPALLASQRRAPNREAFRIFDEGLTIVVRAMRDLVEPQMEQQLGQRWPAVLSRHMNTEFRRQDILSYKNALCSKGPHRTLITNCFPVPFTRWRQQLFVATKWRNELVGHPDDDVSVGDAKQGVAALLMLAEAAQFGCADELEALLHRASESEATKVQPESPNDDTSDAEAGALEQSKLAQSLAQEALDAVVQLQSTLTTTSNRVDELKASEKARQAAEDRATSTAKALSKAERKLKKKRKALAAAEESLRKAAPGTSDWSENPAEATAGGDVDPPRGQAPMGPSGRPLRIGQRWPFPPGDTEWILHAYYRVNYLTRSEDGYPLTSITSRAGEIVAAFLKRLPDGGPIWVDADGHACAHPRGNYIYLGRIPELSQATMAAKHRPFRRRTPEVAPVPTKDSVLPPPSSVLWEQS